MHPTRKLEALLLDMFPPEEVLRLLAGHRLGSILQGALPSPKIAPAAFFHEVTILLDRHRAIDPEILALFRSARPARADEILTALDPWLQEIPSDEVYAGRYRLEKAREDSPTGFYCHATDLEWESAVRVKVIASGMEGSAEEAAAFRQGLEIQENELHPHVQRVLDMRLRTTPRYIVYEAANMCLDKRLLLPDRLTREEVLPGMRGILAALGFLHARGIIHRNLKPSNIVVKEKGTWLITDFKAARWEGRTDHAASTLRNRSWAWLPPEVRRDPTAAEPRSDVYGAGLLLYEVLTGRTPVDLHEATDLSEMEPELAAVVLRATRRSPEDRYASAADMLAALPAE